MTPRRASRPFGTVEAAALGLTIGYALGQLRFLSEWLRVPAVAAARAPDPGEWTALIAARDEAGSIARAVASVREQVAEVVVVDDHSADATAERARRAGARVETLPPGASGKQAALAVGMRSARTSWVAMLDADAAAPARWIGALEASAVGGAVAVAGPVLLAPARTWFERWQALDFCGMMAITAASLWRGGFAMGNGANLAVRREAFAAVGGYGLPTDARAAASGDDLLLVAKLMRRYPGRVAFAKTREAAVATPPSHTLRAFVRQRWRWAAKTSLAREPTRTATLAAAWAFHLGLLAGLPLAAAGKLDRRVLAAAWLAKAGVDLALLRSAARFFGRAHLLDASYPAQSVAHAAYVAGIGTLALLPLDYEWKGRRHRV